MCACVCVCVCIVEPYEIRFIPFFSLVFSEICVLQFLLISSSDPFVNE